MSHSLRVTYRVIAAANSTAQESFQISHYPFRSFSEALIALQWQETEIDPRFCKISKNFFQPFFLKVLIK